MASLGLVAYGSSDESESSDVEDSGNDLKEPKIEVKKDNSTAKVNSSQLEPVTSGTGSTDPETADDPISDEDEDYRQVSVSHRLSLPPPAKPGSDASAVLPIFRQRGATAGTSEDPLTGPQLEEDIIAVQSAATIVGVLPHKKSEKTGQFTFDDELEDEVKPKQYEKDLPKPAPKPKKRQPVKITAPSLNSIDSDDEDSGPQKKYPAPGPAVQGKVNLFSKLPPPKNIAVKEVNRSLVPHTLTKRPVPANKAVPSKKPTLPHSKVSKPLPPAREDSDDEDDEAPVNFFDIGKTEQIQPDLSAIPTSSARSFGSSHGPGQSSLVAEPEEEEAEMEVEPGPAMMQPDDDDEEYETPYGGEMQQYLQDDEFLKIQGRKHRGKEEISIIDVTADSQVDRMELMKTLSEETQTTSHSSKKKGMPGSQARRKHQITYLAFQAKQRELELKNQWAANRQTRKQTQSKYGF